MSKEEVIVTLPQDVPKGVEALKRGDIVLCFPGWAQILDRKLKEKGIEVEVKVNAWCYEYIPKKRSKP